MLRDILSENFLHDTEDQLAHLEHAITDALILSITGHNCQVECELLAPLVRMGGTRLTNPYQVVALGSVASTKISGLLAQQKKKQTRAARWQCNRHGAMEDAPSEEPVPERGGVPDFWKNVESCVPCNLQRHI